MQQVKHQTYSDHNGIVASDTHLYPYKHLHLSLTKAIIILVSSAIYYRKFDIFNSPYVYTSKFYHINIMLSIIFNICHPVQLCICPSNVILHLPYFIIEKFPLQSCMITLCFIGSKMLLPYLSKFQL